jgi:anti-sigma regulatory factor (Ser/Thr protein kinase)
LAVDTTTIAATAGDHAVQFYEQDSELVDIVGRWLRDTASGDVSIVVATEAHCALFAAAAAAAAEGLHESPRGSVVWLDAAETLEQLTVAGEIDPAAFDTVVGGAVRRATRAGGAVRVYGEMVALLWGAGNVVGAIELEGLWNDLVRKTPFALLCSYPAAIEDESGRAEALAQVCEAHSACHHTWSNDGTAVIDASVSQGVQAALPARPSAPGHARRVTAAALRQWGYSPAAMLDVGLVVSELVTNAVRHADSHVTLSVRRDEDHALRIAVQDATPLASLSTTKPFAAQPGRGLGIVAEISADWGVEPLSGGKIVWAQVRASR